MGEFQKIKVEIDGVEVVAEVLDIVNLDNDEYAIYRVPKDNETSDVFASKIVKDMDGSERLVDIEDEYTKTRLLEMIKTLFLR